MKSALYSNITLMIPSITVMRTAASFCAFFILILMYGGHSDLMASGSATNDVAKSAVLYSENGLTVSFILYDHGTRELGVPGDLREYPVFKLAVHIDNQTGKDIRFMDHGTVSYQFYAVPGTGSFSQYLNPTQWFPPGLTVLAWGLPFAYDDVRYELINMPSRYFIPAWTTRETREDRRARERASRLNEALDNNQIPQMQREHSARVQQLLAEERRIAEEERRAEEQRRRAEERRTANQAPGEGCGALTDIDGNTYRTVRIGSQCWMAENLRTTRYQNGDQISNLRTEFQWQSQERQGSLQGFSNRETGAYSYFRNQSDNIQEYGMLYNWHAVDDRRNICPSGWHVPSDNEWKQLETSLGMNQSEANMTDWRGTSANVGGKLKSDNSGAWNSPNSGATNESGFNALPGGNRSGSGGFIGILQRGHWWTSTPSGSDPERAYRRGMENDNQGVYRNIFSKRVGFSVRCVQS